MFKDILNLIKTALDSIKTSSDSIATAVTGIPGAVKSDATHDGYLDKDDFIIFAAKQAALPAATAEADGYLDKDDFAIFAAKQAALTNPVTIAAGAPATAGAAGVKGQMYFDGTDMYLCTATDTWIKGTLVLATWS